MGGGTKNNSWVIGGGARVASELVVARWEAAQGEGKPEERRLGGRGIFRSGGVEFHGQAFLSRLRTSRSTQKQRLVMF
jgi:hypothetical protein